MKHFQITLFLFFLLMTSCVRQHDVTFVSLLDEMVNYDEAARYPSVPFSACQESSYDRRSVHPDSAGWFANNDGFGMIRTDTVDGLVEHVLFDQDGPGVITRFWLTTMDKRGVMRFYFDKAKTPQWEIPAYDLLRSGLPLGEGLVQAHPNYTPDGKGGNTLFLPIPYNDGCKITFELPDSLLPSPKYYHINYRKYPAGTVVETFSKQLVEANKEKIAEVNSVLLHAPMYTEGVLTSLSQSLEDRNSLTVKLPEGTNAIRAIDIKVDVAPSQYAQVMRGLILNIAFDGVRTVQVPLSDFSGGGMGAPASRSWFLSADGKGQVESRWVMPYRQNAILQVENLTAIPAEVEVSVCTDKWVWDERTLYFHTSWRQERGIHVEADPNNDKACIEWNVASLKGRGVYRGDVLSLFNHTLAWYGEGDEKIWVDDDVFPSHFGTGTEDYYNCSWAPVIPFDTPFGGATRADAKTSAGYNTFFRTRNLDQIPFERKLRFDLEMLSWISGEVDYAATVFWYGDLNAVAENGTPMEEALYPLPVQPADPAEYKIADHAIEFEDLKPIARSHDLFIDGQSMLTFQNDKWSGSKQLICSQGKPGSYLEFEFKPEENRPYELILYLTQAPDYGILSFSVNGREIGKRYDACSAPRFDVRNSGPIRLGKHVPAADGTIRLKVELVGRNKESHGNGNVFGLDCIVLK